MRIYSCGPVITGPAADSMAKELVGTQGLYLLTWNGDGTATQYGQITTPTGMTLDEKIATAREVLGIRDVRIDPGAEGPWWVQPSVWITLGIIVLIVGSLFAVRRARRT